MPVISNDIVKAYQSWKKAPPAEERAMLTELVKTVMDHGEELSDGFSSAQVRSAVTQCTGNASLGLTVGAGWGLYAFIRPHGAAAVAEATEWIEQLIESAPERRRQFAAVLERLLAQDRKRPR